MCQEYNYKWECGLFKRYNMKSFKKDDLLVQIYESRAKMGEAAANDAAATIVKLLKEKDEINMIFAAAPSQNEFLASLILHKEIDWTRVNGFHMDEYVGVDSSVSQSFVHFLHEAIFDRVPFKQVFCLNGKNEPKAECKRYSELLKKYPVDIVCMAERLFSRDYEPAWEMKL